MQPAGRWRGALRWCWRELVGSWRAGGGLCLMSSESTASGTEFSNSSAEQVATVERLCRMYVNGFFVADLGNLCQLLDIMAGIVGLRVMN